jgi:hypothetical protein
MDQKSREHGAAHRPESIVNSLNEDLAQSRNLTREVCVQWKIWGSDDAWGGFATRHGADRCLAATYAGVVIGIFGSAIGGSCGYFCSKGLGKAGKRVMY